MFLSRDFFSRSNNFVFHIVQGVPFIISFLSFDVKHYSVHRSVILQKFLIAAKVPIIANVIKNRPNFILQDISSYNRVNSLILLS